VSNLTPLINLFGYEKVSRAIKKASWDIEKAFKILAEEKNESFEELSKKLNLKRMTGL